MNYFYCFRNVKNLNKINKLELEAGIAGTSGSWHKKYKDSAWIFIGGLPYDLTEGDAVCVFSQYGEIVNINLIRDRKTGKTKGFGFLCYEDQRSTVLAVDNLNGVKICGRTIRVDHVEEYKVKLHEDADEATKRLAMEGCAPKEYIPKDDEKKKKSKKKKKKSKKSRKKSKRGHSSDDSATTDSEADAKPNVKVKIKTENIEDGKPVKKEGEYARSINSKWDDRRADDVALNSRNIKKEKVNDSHNRSKEDYRYRSQKLKSRSKSPERKGGQKCRSPRRRDRLRSRSRSIENRRREKNYFGKERDTQRSKYYSSDGSEKIRSRRNRDTRSRSVEYTRHSRRSRDKDDRYSKSFKRSRSRSYDKESRKHNRRKSPSRSRSRERTKSRSTSPRHYRK